VKILWAGLRWFFRYFYTTLAWSYDWVAYLVSVGQWQAWVATALQSIEGRPVLELGHGPGHLLLELGDRAIGVDPSPQMSRIARRRLRRAGPAGWLVRARSQRLPFRSAGFACVVTTFPTEYILEAESQRESWRVLAPGGRLIIVASAEFHGGGLADRAAGWLFRLTGQAGSVGPDWTAGLTEAGFELARREVALPRSTVVQFVASKPQRADPQALELESAAATRMGGERGNPHQGR
jgi:ubiquinone/menaquinone biosynthesis C-methylase UbiE